MHRNTYKAHEKKVVRMKTGLRRQSILGSFCTNESSRSFQGFHETGRRWQDLSPNIGSAGHCRAYTSLADLACWMMSPLCKQHMRGVCTYCCRTSRALAGTFRKVKLHVAFLCLFGVKGVIWKSSMYSELVPKNAMYLPSIEAEEGCS